MSGLAPALRGTRRADSGRLPPARARLPFNPSLVVARLRPLARAAAIAMVVFWFVALRPQALGGPAGYVLVAGTSMEPTLEPGALVVVLRQPTYEVGDVIAYRIADGGIADGMNVIHRITGGDGTTGYTLQGDNVAFVDPWHPRDAEVVGKVVFAVPGLAPLIALLRSPLFLASAAAGIAVYIVLGWPALAKPDRPRQRPGRRDGGQEA